LIFELIFSQQNHGNRCRRLEHVSSQKVVSFLEQPVESTRQFNK